MQQLGRTSMPGGKIRTPLPAFPCLLYAAVVWSKSKDSFPYLDGVSVIVISWCASQPHCSLAWRHFWQHTSGVACQLGWQSRGWPTTCRLGARTEPRLSPACRFTSPLLAGLGGAILFLFTRHAGEVPATSHPAELHGQHRHLSKCHARLPALISAQAGSLAVARREQDACRTSSHTREQPPPPPCSAAPQEQLPAVALDVSASRAKCPYAYTSTTK